MARPVPITFSDAGQVYISAKREPGRAGTSDCVLDLLNVHAPTADEDLFLNVWRVSEEPADLSGSPLDAADRIGGGPIPIGVPTAGRTVALGLRCSREDGAGFVVSITTGTNATGDPTAAVSAAFMLEAG